MLSILIVDDTPEKEQTLRKFILDNFKEVKNSDIEWAECTNDAFRMLSRKYYDLVMLDLFIKQSKRKDAKADPENAVNFIELLNEYGDTIKQPAHILGITQMTKIPEQYKTCFDDNLWSLFRYGDEYKDWEDKLRIKLNYLLTSKMRMQRNPVYDFDVAIINALYKPEHSALKCVLGEDGWEKIKYPADECNTYFIKTIVSKGGTPIRIVATYQSQMASVASASLTAKMLYHFRPKYVFMTGIAAAVERDGYQYGDVLIAEECWDGASGKYKDGKFLPDFKHIRIDSSMINILSVARDNPKLMKEITEASSFAKDKCLRDLTVHIGQMASVPAVIAEAEKLDEIKDHARKLMGIEMETYGVYYAAENSVDPRPIGFASLKSISDFADGHKGDDYQEYASYTSAAFLKYVILNELDY